MVRIKMVFPQQAEDHLVEECLVGMPITTARVCAARAAEIRMRIRILLAMQRSAQCDQSQGMAPGIFITLGHFGKVGRYDSDDICRNLAWLSASVAEAVKPEVLLCLVE